MSTTDSDFDPAPFAGELAARDYAAVREFDRSRLRAWIERLPTLTDAELAREAERAIYEAAHANSLSMPNDPSHCRATACSHESGNRMIRDGHDRWCGPSIYDRAYVRAAREAGINWTVDSQCHPDCPAKR